MKIKRFKIISIVLLMVFLSQQISWACGYNLSLLVNSPPSSLIYQDHGEFNLWVAKRVYSLTKPSFRHNPQELKSAYQWLKTPSTQTVPCSAYVLYNLLQAKGLKPKIEDISASLISLDLKAGNLKPPFTASRIDNSLYAMAKTAKSQGLELYPSRLNSHTPKLLNSQTPFIAHLSSGGQSGHFVLVTKVSLEKVYFFYDKGDTFLPYEKFLEEFSGYCLLSSISLPPIPDAESKTILGAGRAYHGRSVNISSLFKKPSTMESVIGIASAFGGAFSMGGSGYGSLAAMGIKIGGSMIFKDSQWGQIGTSIVAGAVGGGINGGMSGGWKEGLQGAGVGAAKSATISGTMYGVSKLRIANLSPSVMASIGQLVAVPLGSAVGRGLETGFNLPMYDGSGNRLTGDQLAKAQAGGFGTGFWQGLTFQTPESWGEKVSFREKWGGALQHYGSETASIAVEVFAPGKYSSAYGMGINSAFSVFTNTNDSWGKAVGISIGKGVAMGGASLLLANLTKDMRVTEGAFLEKAASSLIGAGVESIFGYNKAESAGLTPTSRWGIFSKSLTDNWVNTSKSIVTFGNPSGNFLNYQGSYAIAKMYTFGSDIAALQKGGLKGFDAVRYAWNQYVGSSLHYSAIGDFAAIAENRMRGVTYANINKGMHKLEPQSLKGFMASNNIRNPTNIGYLVNLVAKNPIWYDMTAGQYLSHTFTHKGGDVLTINSKGEVTITLVKGSDIDNSKNNLNKTNLFSPKNSEMLKTLTTPEVRRNKPEIKNQKVNINIGKNEYWDYHDPDGIFSGPVIKFENGAVQGVEEKVVQQDNIAGTNKSAGYENNSDPDGILSGPEVLSAVKQEDKKAQHYLLNSSAGIAVPVSEEFFKSFVSLPHEEQVDMTKHLVDPEGPPLVFELDSSSEADSNSEITDGIKKEIEKATKPNYKEEIDPLIERKVMDGTATDGEYRKYQEASGVRGMMESRAANYVPKMMDLDSYYEAFVKADEIETDQPVASVFNERPDQVDTEKMVRHALSPSQMLKDNYGVGKGSLISSDAQPSAVPAVTARWENYSDIARKPGSPGAEWKREEIRYAADGETVNKISRFDDAGDKVFELNRNAVRDGQVDIYGRGYKDGNSIGTTVVARREPGRNGVPGETIVQEADGKMTAYHKSYDKTGNINMETVDTIDEATGLLRQVGVNDKGERVVKRLNRDLTGVFELNQKTYSQRVRGFDSFGNEITAIKYPDKDDNSVIDTSVDKKGSNASTNTREYFNKDIGLSQKNTVKNNGELSVERYYGKGETVFDFYRNRNGEADGFGYNKNGQYIGVQKNRLDDAGNTIIESAVYDKNGRDYTMIEERYHKESGKKIDRIETNESTPPIIRANIANDYLSDIAATSHGAQNTDSAAIIVRKGGAGELTDHGFKVEAPTEKMVSDIGKDAYKGEMKGPIPLNALIQPKLGTDNIIPRPGKSNGYSYYGIHNDEINK